VEDGDLLGARLVGVLVTRVDGDLLTGLVDTVANPTIAFESTGLTQRGDAWQLGGLLVTETMFNYRGLGLLVADAARGQDIPMLMGAVFIVGAIAMMLNLIADILIAWLNPRVRYGSKS
jgi:hypothetical protein